MVNVKRKTAIIGNGCAAAECIIALRQAGCEDEIHVFADNKWDTGNPMLTTYYLAGKIKFDRLFPYGPNKEFYRRYEAEIHSSSPVVSLDAENKVVANRDGYELIYDQCLIASGASPVIPPIEGVTSQRVYTLRTVDDAVRLEQVLKQKPHKVLIVGASMVGVKLVELLSKMGMEVCLVDMADHVFPLISHTECSQVIEERLIRKGIKLKLGAGIDKIEDTFNGIKAYFSDDKSEEADILMMCIGVRPNIGFVDCEQVQAQDGVLVNEHMMTGVPGLYAAGDVAQGMNLLTGTQQIIGLWANARYQGRTAGRNIAGKDEEYAGNIPHNITHFMGMDFIGIGNVCEYDRVKTKQDNNRYMQFFWRDGKLTGANLIDFKTEAGVVKNAVIKGLIQARLIRSESFPVIQNCIMERIMAEVEYS